MDVGQVVIIYLIPVTIRSENLVSTTSVSYDHYPKFVHPKMSISYYTENLPRVLEFKNILATDLRLTDLVFVFVVLWLCAKVTRIAVGGIRSMKMCEMYIKN